MCHCAQLALHILSKTVQKAPENVIKSINTSLFLSICFHIPDSVLLLLVCYLNRFSRPSTLRSPPLLVELWRVTLVSCAASGEMTESDNIIYIVCGERSQRGSHIYATLGDLPPLPSPGPIHHMASIHPPPNGALLKRALERVLSCRSVFICGLTMVLCERARQHFCCVRARGLCVHQQEQPLACVVRQMDSILQQAKLQQ